MTTILLIGGADTGRAPMAAALLQRLLAARGYAWSVGSAGVLGHDGAPAEREARDTMAHMGLDIHSHEARSLSPDLAEQAALLIALDRGAALVLRSRFAEAQERIHTLGELAEQPRDIPDPFRMQIGAWMTYAREIEALLIAALPRIIALSGAPQIPPQPAGDAQPPARGAAAGRIARILALADEMPDVVDWAAARGQIGAELERIAADPRDPSDLALAYVGLLRAALALTATPGPAQRAALREATDRLDAPIAQADLDRLAAQLARWNALPEA